MSDISRRTVFQIIGAVPAVAAVGSAAKAHIRAGMVSSAAAATGPYKRQTFDDHQWQTILVLCDLIIPADEHSGSAGKPVLRNSLTTGSRFALNKMAILI